MVLAVVVFLYTWNWPIEAGLYPKIICVIIFLLGALLCLFPKDLHRKTFSTILAALREDRMVLYIALLTVVFILSIDYLGFFVALPPFLIAGQLMMGMRDIRKILLPTIIIPTFIYLVFVKILTIQIPVAFWMM